MKENHMFKEALTQEYLDSIAEWNLQRPTDEEISHKTT